MVLRKKPYIKMKQSTHKQLKKGGERLNLSYKKNQLEMASSGSCFIFWKKLLLSCLYDIHTR